MGKNSMKNNDENSRRVYEFTKKNRLRRKYAAATGDLRVLAGPEPHYHLVYNGVPSKTIGYETETIGARAIKRIADAHDPHVVYYEDDPMIQLTQAKITGRTGVFRIMIQLGLCNDPCKEIIRPTSVGVN